jgi:predicted phage terminase large subunit-like protein
VNSHSFAAALQRTHLFPFVWKGFDLLHPEESFAPSFHIEAICHALERVAAGQTRRLLITVPPRHGKSICTAVALPAWMLGKDPSQKIIVASYGGDLAAKHSRDFRTIVSSPWYESLFAGMRLKPGGNRADEQETTRYGGRKAVSLGGAVTGFGADLIIVDDLMKAADAPFPIERQRVLDYYEQTLLSRLNNKAEGRIIVIAQRLHEDDLPGYLLESGRFEHLNLPAIAEADATIPYGLNRAKHRRKGDLLWPEREPKHILDQLRIEMGPSAFSAQYQQDPTPPGGNRVRWDWFKTYEGEPDEQEPIWVVQSWDTGFSAQPTSDFSVGTTWGYCDNCWRLLHLERERYDFTDLKTRVKALADRWRASLVLIEKTGAGIPLLQQLCCERKDARRGYIGKTPRLDKATRLEAQMARLATGRYHLPHEAPWLEDFRRELLAFPNGKYDDQVDSMVQFLEWSASPRGESFVERNPVTGRQRTVRRQQSMFRR